jgi:hypothetical protein
MKNTPMIVAVASAPNVSDATVHKHLQLMQRDAAAVGKRLSLRLPSDPGPCQAMHVAASAANVAVRISRHNVHQHRGKARHRQLWHLLAHESPATILVVVGELPKADRCVIRMARRIGIPVCELPAKAGE